MHVVRMCATHGKQQRYWMSVFQRMHAGRVSCAHGPSCVVRHGTAERHKRGTLKVPLCDTVSP